jgi:hypothetical protein
MRALGVKGKNAPVFQNRAGGRIWRGMKDTVPQSALTSGLPFMKMHGAGNDFVVIDRRNGGPAMTAGLAQARILASSSGTATAPRPGPAAMPRAASPIS